MGGRYLADIAAEWGVTQQEAAVRLKPGNACYFQMREDDVQRVMAHPLVDDRLRRPAARRASRIRGCGVRFRACCASYWREKGLLRLEEAVHKMTGLSAARFRIGEPRLC